MILFDNNADISDHGGCAALEIAYQCRDKSGVKILIHQITVNRNFNSSNGGLFRSFDIEFCIENGSITLKLTKNI